MSLNTDTNVSNKNEEFKPLIVAFCCNWCSYAGADLAGTSRLKYPANVKIIRVPCSCRVNINFVLRAFQNGADGVVIAGCHPGDCHYSTGNYHTRRRFSLITNLTEYIGIEKERLKVDWISAAEGNKFATVMNDILVDVYKLGPNKKLRDARWKI
ncbi:MAG: hydrogenase iron-sulfur subunit [Psychrilyobacter sp.]|uniref:hydrogenase iron-sulfur subunit n=1 Tax=Psychrilyobacter sp. TaxID=2586924 RepID=UPI003C74D5A6